MPRHGCRRCPEVSNFVHLAPLMCPTLQHEANMCRSGPPFLMTFAENNRMCSLVIWLALCRREPPPWTQCLPPRPPGAWRQRITPTHWPFGWPIRIPSRERPSHLPALVPPQARDPPPPPPPEGQRSHGPTTCFLSRTGEAEPGAGSSRVPPTRPTQYLWPAKQGADDILPILSGK